jgi:hypothetical protein
MLVAKKVSRMLLVAVVLAPGVASEGLLSCQPENTTLPWPNSPVSLCPQPESHIRPDIGGATLPWLHAAFLLLLTIFVSIPRHLDRGGLITAICITFFFTLVTVSFTILSYCSTRFAADKVLTWLPLPAVAEYFSAVHLLIQLLQHNDQVESHRGMCVMAVWMWTGEC